MIYEVAYYGKTKGKRTPVKRRVFSSRTSAVEFAKRRKKFAWVNEICTFLGLRFSSTTIFRNNK